MLSKYLQALAGNAAEPVFVESVFSTYLYTGNGSTQTITNGIDLAGEGGMVWIKSRTDTYDHRVFDTLRGVNYNLFTNDTTASSFASDSLTAFNSEGFTIGSRSQVNYAGTTFASWTFRKAPKFFDVVTYTGNGAFSQQINHNLGSKPGFILIKRTNTTGDWAVAARVNDSAYAELKLNTTGANLGNFNPSATATSVFVGENWATTSPINASGSSYVMYLFAHDAGGFGDDGLQDIISCGSFTTDGSGNATVNLGWEPQWVMYKRSSSIGNWGIGDNMRGLLATASGPQLTANTSNAETSSGVEVRPTATGFVTDSFQAAESTTYIYIAIRRGPMKTPTSGTSVFDAEFEGNVPDGQKPFTRSSTGVVDMAFRSYRPGGVWNGSQVWSRLQDSNYFNGTASTAAETSGTAGSFAYNNGWINSTASSTVTSQIDWMFRRAPGFFDVVCYTGTGANQNVAHNLTVAPELMIVKNRSNAANWRVYDAFNGATKRGSLNDSQAWDVQSSMWNDTAPTAAVFTVGTSNSASSQTYVAYLFATVAGVSKVGSYTGTGTTQQINCGFSAGARFVLIKRTDSTGDWYVWDSARGIVAGNDPYLLLNSTAAEVTSTDYIDPYSAGFEISSTAPAAINASGGSFIFFAVS